MLRQIRRKLPKQIRRQHLRHIRPCQRVIRRNHLIRHQPKLGVGIIRCRAEDVATLRQQIYIRLPAVGQTIHHMVKETAAAVPPRPRQRLKIRPAVLLLRYIGAKMRQPFCRQLPLTQRRRRIPPLGNHPIRPFGRVKHGGKNHKMERMATRFHPVNRFPAPFGIQLPLPHPNLPLLSLQPRHQLPRKAQPRRPHRSHSSWL